MREILLIVVFIIISFFSFAGNADLFQVNEKVLENTFSELTLLEYKIEKGQNISTMMNRVDFEQTIQNSTSSQDFDLSIFEICVSDIGIDACLFGIYLTKELYYLIVDEINRHKKYDNQNLQEY